MKTYSVKFFSAILAMAVILLVLYSGCKRKATDLMLPTELIQLWFS
ncbi:hypothetical protein [Pedobacter panaciterrae]